MWFYSGGGPGPGLGPGSVGRLIMDKVFGLQVGLLVLRHSRRWVRRRRHPG